MIANLNGEIWKELKFTEKHTNNIRVEISNFGRIKSFNTNPEGILLNGNLIDGFLSIRIKLFTERDPNTQKRIENMREQIALLIRDIGKMRTRNKIKRIKDSSYFEVEEKIKVRTELLDGLKKKYQKEYRECELKRAINKGGLVHRFVAEFFLEKPSDDHILVGHLDYNKSNNHVSNLKWMTRRENIEHQQSNPTIIASRLNRKKSIRNENSKVYKLNSTKVMLIKKRINEGVPLRKIAKTFKVTETQILRIKRGENWGHIQAAN